MFTLLKYGLLSKRIGGITVATLPTHRKPDRTEVTSPNLLITFPYASTGDFFLKEKPVLRETIKSRKCFIDTLHFEVSSVMQLIRHYAFGVKNSLHYPDKWLPNYDILCHC